MEIASAIREMSQPNDAWEPLDVLVIARGGGSIEDLWEFNEEIVARAIFHSPIPIVSAVGHEVDFTIADFVADLRAPTPSAAAELIVPDARDLERRVQELQNCVEKCGRNFINQARNRLSALSQKALARELRQRLRDAQQQLDFFKDALFRHLKNRRLVEGSRLTNLLVTLKAHSPAREVAARRTRVHEAERDLNHRVARRLTHFRSHWERTAAMLRILGPEATLERGYSITRDEEGKVIRTVLAVVPQMKIKTRVYDGEFDSTVA
jgi:exodeoxyribonuclease VII large subunit